MEKLKEFVETNEVDYTVNLISEKDLDELLSKKLYEVGPQLKEYLSKYGYLGFGSIELYGINSIQKEKSDLIAQTDYLNKYFIKSKGFIALENMGEGDYAIINREDKVFVLSTENDTLTDTGKDLEAYILSRFSEEM